MTDVRHVAVVPSAPGLLSRYASPEAPLGELRACTLATVGWLLGHHPDGVQVLAAAPRDDNRARGVAESAGWRVGRELLLAGGADEDAVTRMQPGEAPTAAGILVVANGSATRDEKAPGHLDPRAAGFDAAVGAALATGDAAALAGLDEELARELWCDDAPVLRALGRWAGEAVVHARMDLDETPFGVQYWVVRWTCVS